MSTIGTPIYHGITLGTAGSYASPLSITASGTIDNGGTGDAVYGPAGYAWTVTNAGAFSAAGTGNSGINLLAGGHVGNSGQIAGGYDGIYIGGAAGTIVNSGAIAATGTARYDDGIDLGQSGFAGYIGNSSTGLISAVGGAGIYAYGAASIVNAGTIQSVQTDGIVLGHGGQIVNSGSAALIVGYQYGIYAEKFADATIINSGTIAQTGTFFDAAISLALAALSPTAPPTTPPR